MRDCENCKHYVLSENGEYRSCEKWRCVDEMPKTAADQQEASKEE